MTYEHFSDIPQEVKNKIERDYEEYDIDSESQFLEEKQIGSSNKVLMNGFDEWRFEFLKKWRGN